MGQPVDDPGDRHVGRRLGVGLWEGVPQFQIRQQGLGPVLVAATVSDQVHEVGCSGLAVGQGLIDQRLSLRLDSLLELVDDVVGRALLLTDADGRDGRHQERGEHDDDAEHHHELNERERVPGWVPSCHGRLRYWIPLPSSARLKLAMSSSPAPVAGSAPRPPGPNVASFPAEMIWKPNPSALFTGLPLLGSE